MQIMSFAYYFVGVVSSAVMRIIATKNGCTCTFMALARDAKCY